MPARKTLIYPVFLPMRGCPGRCVYCDQTKISGAEEFDLEECVRGVGEFVRRNPQREKQIAFYGGTFTALHEGFRADLTERVLEVCDPLTTLRVSTHPLFVSPETLVWCGARRVRTIELGIQDFSDAVLRSSGRGYTGAEAVAAVRRVREAGFETGVQLMPGLPGWTAETLAENRKQTRELRPDLLRLYPVIVIEGTPLAELYLRGEFAPLGLAEAISQCADWCLGVEPLGIKVIKLGLPSNLPAADIVAGPWHPEFGALVRKEMLSRQMAEGKREVPGAVAISS